MSDHEAYAELVVGHALDALEPTDEQVLLEHLPGCAECRTLLAELRQVAATMAYGVDEVEPPAELFERVREALAAPVPASFAAAPSEARRRARQRSGSGLDELTGPRSRHARRLGLVSRLGAGVVVAALLVVGGYAVHVRSSQASTAKTAAAERAVLTHLQDPGAYSVALASGGAATGAAVVDGRHVYLMVANLGRNDVRSSIYVLWAEAPAGKLLPVTGFDVTNDAFMVVSATLPAGLSEPLSFGVTHEAGRSLPASPGTSVLGVSTAG